MDAENPTIVRAANCKALQPLPASVIADPEPYQRSPTLLAGEAPGSQGPVQVWSPQRWRLWLLPAGWLLAAEALLLAPPFWSHWPRLLLFTLSHALTFSFWLLVAWAAFRRLPYLTTDDAGIGITQLFRPAQAIRWSEIVSLETRFNFGPASHLTLAIAGAERRLEVNLAGYPRSMRRAILALILNRAELRPAAFQIRRYVRDPAKAIAEAAPRRTPAS